MTVNFRSEDNLFRNAVLNCIEVLKKVPSELGRTIRNYYTEDVLNPVTPCFVVTVKNSDDTLRASQALTRMRYTVNILLEIWYLHSELTEETKRNEITFILYEISDLFRRNITLNGFAPKLGIDIAGIRWAPQLRGNRILSGGVISLLVKPIITINNAV